MRTRPRVLLDVDGVLGDYVAAILPVARAIAGKAFLRSDVDQWDIAKALSLSPPEGDAMFAATRELGFCASIPVLPGAVEGVRALRSVSDVYFVTSPTHGRHWYYERTEWLVRHFDALVEHVVHAKRKELVAGDVFVDDKPEHVWDWCRHHAAGRGILWDAPYNRSVDMGYLPRTMSWKHVLDIVGEVARRSAIGDVGVK